MNNRGVKISEEVDIPRIEFPVNGFPYRQLST